MPGVSHPGRTLAACALASSLVFLDGTVVNVALPAIRADLGGTLAAQQWVVEGFLLSLSAALLLGGSLGDLLGHHRVLRLGVLAFGATSLLCAVAPSTELLVAGRVIQGLAGALLVPVSLAIITDTFQASERGAAIGTWTAWTSVAMIAGPLVGGIVVDHLDWRLIFAVNVPLVGVVLWLARSIAPNAPGERVPIDVLGALLVSLGLSGVVFALVEQPAQGWSAPQVAGLGGAALLAAFIWWERRTAHPMLPLGLFRERDFAVINVATLLLYAPLGASTFLLSVYLQQVAGYEAATAGLALLPTTLVVITAAHRFGGLADRVGARALVGGGAAIVAVAFALLMRIDQDAPYVSQVFPAVLTLGIGLAMAVAPLTATVLAAAPAERSGVASGVNNAASRVAGLLAIAALGGLAATSFAGRVDAASERATSPPQLAALAQARDDPFVLATPGLRGDDADAVRGALADASVHAYRETMLICAALAALGALTAGFGLSRRVDAARRDDAAQAAAGS